MLRAFRLLARLKRLRGTAFDPFGRTAERRIERRLLVEYEAMLDEVLHGLDAGNHGAGGRARQICRSRSAAMATSRRRNLARAKAKEAGLLDLLRGQGALLQAAE